METSLKHPFSRLYDGEFNYETGRFTYDEFIEFDSGFDFYAAQTLKHEDGRTILIA